MELKPVIITQARTGSTRLPGKVLQKVAGKTFLQIHAERIRKSKLCKEVIIATSVNVNDERIAQVAESLGFTCSRGSENDVLSRYYHAAKDSGADIVIRVTSDCPFADPELIDEMLQFFMDNNYDYVSNTYKYTYPDGIDVEIMSFKALEIAYNDATLTSEREHVTPFIRTNSDIEGGKLFRGFNFTNRDALEVTTRMTLDEPADQQLLTILIEKLGTDKSWKKYYEYLLENPEINKINNFISINEGYEKSVKQDAANN